MKKELISIPDLDFEYKLWKNRIVFYAEEINIFISRLSSLKVEYELDVDKEKELLKLLKKDVDLLLNEIKIQEEAIAYFSDDYPIKKSHAHYLAHKDLQMKKNNLSMEFLKLIKKIEAGFEPFIKI